MRAFAEQDANDPPPEGQWLLFVGSSSIRAWSSLEQDFQPWPVLNRGFGGSQTSDVLAHEDRLLKPHQPAMVLIYEGDNDIAAGKPAEQVVADVQQLARRIRHHHGEVPIGFIAIKPSLARWHLREEMAKANQQIRQWMEDQNNLHFIDIWHPMLNEKATPRQELFIGDGLHLNAKGYKLWASIVRPVVEKALNETEPP